MAEAPHTLEGVRLTSCLLPQMNEFDYAALCPATELTTFLLPAALRTSFAAGLVRVRPLPYSQIAAAFEVAAPFDLAIFQVTSPGADGLCSFGPCADFAPIVWPRAHRRVGFINPQLPRTRRGPTIPRAALDIAVDSPGAFVSGAEAAPGPELRQIAEIVSAIIPDGVAIQTGIGGAPAAAVWALTRHRGLTVRSGMVTPGYRALARAGALAKDADHVTGMALGDADFMAWAASVFRFSDARETHGAIALASVGPLFAINSALEVDLFGQANLEWRDGRLYSGLGGAPDFAAAARRSGGRAVLALPSTGRGPGAVSRIVPRLASPSISLARHETDIVVTEHGLADLADTDLDIRAARLIAIADPPRRSALQAAWSEIRRGL
jgi:acyl-CoA hydrolase